MTKEFIDHYATLGVPREASYEDIKKAYRKLILKHHPDKNPSQIIKALQKTKAILKAREVLSNKTQRDQYDREYDFHKKQNTGKGKHQRNEANGSYSHGSFSNKKKQNAQHENHKYQNSKEKQNAQHENHKYQNSKEKQNAQNENHKYPNSKEKQNRDLYDNLGIEKNASFEDIKKAYLKLIDKYSPDNDNPYVQKMVLKILRAYIVLSDPELRANYDKEINNNSNIYYANYDKEINNNSNIYSKWMKPDQLKKTMYIIGGAFFLGFAAYKTFKIIKALNEEALRSASLMSSSIDSKPTPVTVPVEPQEIVLSISKSTLERISIILEQLKDNKAQSTSSIASSVASISNAAFEATKTAVKWTAGSVGTIWKWSAGKLSSEDGGGQSTSSIASSVASISNAAFEATKTAVKWTAGSVGTIWKSSAGKLSSEDGGGQSTSTIASSVASISNATYEATKTAAKWTAGSVGTIWKWSAGKLSSEDGGGQSTSTTVSSVASISNATFEATKTAAKWTAGSVGTIWKWSAGKLSSEDGGGQSTSTIASSVASISNATYEATKTAAKWTAGSATKTAAKIWKWSTGQ